ncbi:MAG: hypothetical protein HY040_27725 [Planctomycetes bacterium]|nr:hypothetical protein [Planctomycetota bacterium]
MHHPISQVLHLVEQGGRLQSVEATELQGRSVLRITILKENPMWRAVQNADPAEAERRMREAQTMTEREIQEHLARAKKNRELTPRELQYVYFLDPDLGYAVRRFQELTTEGRLLRQSTCSDHRKLPGHEIWLPGKCDTENYASGNYPGQIFDSPFWTDVFEVIEYGTTPVPDETFTPKYTVPGTNVTDRTLGIGDVQYRIPARAEDLDGVIAQARAEAEAKFSAARREKLFKTAGLVVATGAITALVVFLIKRYRRKVGTP